MSTSVVIVRRGSITESLHRVSVAVVDEEGRMRHAAGNPDLVSFARSAVKPIQAIPLIEDGAAARYALSSEELALCCASHSAEPVHVTAVLAILRRMGLDASALACGPHLPMGDAAAEALRAKGEAPGRVHNNCSGKHAGMLALARTHGWPIEGYERIDHPVQQRILREISAWTGVAADLLPTAVDGCGVVTFALPLRSMALAFARLASGASADGSAGGQVLRAMAGAPEHVGGTGRLCTRLIRATVGRVVVKVGAEGVYCAAIPEQGLGVALKVEDGATRAAEPALIAVLRALDALPEEAVAQLEDAAEPVVRNTRGDAVGTIAARIRLEARG